MKYRLNTRWLLFPLLLLCCSPGCGVFQRYRPLVVSVRDVETGKPIDQAWVGISYPQQALSLGPADSPGTTSSDGLARLQAMPNGDDGLTVMVRAEGYEAKEQFVSAQEVRAIPPTHWFGAVEQKPPTVVFELYALEPRPTVELVLPAGYRGMVKAALKVEDNFPCTRGQRLVQYALPPSGVIVAKVPPVFGHTAFPEIRARYADGPLLTASAKDQEVGFWWMQSQDNVHTYLVGTAAEYKSCCPSPAEAGVRQRAAGGHGRGRGGKRRGNQQSPDASSGGAYP